MGNWFGHSFRVSTWGESHGGGVGVVIDGCPPRIPLDIDLIQNELDRRRPGQSEIVTPRAEEDRCEIMSGVFEGNTIGTPISILVRNKDARPEAYSEMKEKYRPSHADYTYDAKYGVRNWQGGGRASARETIGRVAAAAVANQVLVTQFAPGLEIVAYVSQVHNLDASVDRETVSRQSVDSNIVRTGDPAMVDSMVAAIKTARADGDSLGGVVECVVRGCPTGLGEPVFDKLEADLAKAMLSIPATKGFEIGSGFGGTRMKGSEHNDTYYEENGRIRTRTNRSGGIQGGISNSENIVFRIAFKPTATIMMDQGTVAVGGGETTLKGRGRHDPCVLPRAVPIVEAMTTLVLCDHAMRHRGQNARPEQPQ